MANFNKVILLGNLTRDPDMRYTPSATAVANTALAVNRVFGKDENRREETCFIDIVAFGRQAEVLAQYLHKGAPLLVEGYLRLNTWEGQDGTKRSKHEVIVEQFQMLGERQGGADTTQPTNHKPPQRQAAPQKPMAQADNEDDVPF